MELPEVQSSSIGVDGENQSACLGVDRVVLPLLIENSSLILRGLELLALHSELRQSESPCTFRFLLSRHDLFVLLSIYSSFLGHEQAILESEFVH